MTTALMSPLDVLVHDLDTVVHATSPGPPRVDAVVAALGSWLWHPDLLPPEFRVGDPAGYRQHLLHVADDGSFSVVALVWLPGQSTPVHDHCSWCVVGVYTGEEHETRYRDRDGVLVVDGTDTAGPGAVSGLLPPGGHPPRRERRLGGGDLAARVRGRSGPARFQHPAALRPPDHPLTGRRARSDQEAEGR